MVRRSLLLVFSEKSTGLFLSLLVMAVVSRLMTPSEVGLFMVASSIVVLIEAFRDFGVAPFLIQEKELSPEVIRSAVTLICLLSLLLGALTYFGADLLAGLYGDPDLSSLVRVASLAFLVAPLSTPLLALLRREMNFAVVAKIGIAAAVVNATTTIGLALLGAGAFSFVWGSVFAACTMSIGALLAKPDWWIFVPCFQHWRRILPFGAWSTVVTLLGMLYEALPRLILGRVIGFGAVGLFSRAVSLTQMPDKLLLSAVQPVVLPALSAKIRSNETVTGPYLLGLALITAVQWPALLTLGFLADPIVRVLMGPQWLDVVPLVRVVCLSTALLCPVYLAWPVLVALGQVRLMAAVSVVTLPAAMMVIYLAAPSGLTAVAIALVVANLIHVGAMMVAVQRHVGFLWRQIGIVALESLAVCLCVAAIPGTVLLLSDGQLSVLPASIAAIGAGIGWYVGLKMTSHPLSAELSHVFALLPQPWKGKRTSLPEVNAIEREPGLAK